MLPRVAALCTAAYLIVAPAHSDSDTTASELAAPRFAARDIAAPVLIAPEDGATTGIAAPTGLVVALPEPVATHPDSAAGGSDKLTTQRPDPIAPIETPSRTQDLAMTPAPEPAPAVAAPPVTTPSVTAPPVTTLPATAPPTQLAALDPIEPSRLSPPIAEPFGLAALRLTSGGVVLKWQGVEADIRADGKVLARCRDDRAHCPAAAQNFLSIVAQGRALTGRARIGVINRAINLSIAATSDLAQWGVPDRWSAPLETFSTGRGDCEDYAIAKYVALTEAGVPAEDVKLVIVRNTAAREDHAVVTVRLDGRWIVLDNRWLTLVAADEMPGVVPLFVLDAGGVRQFTPTSIGARRVSTPASL